MKKNKLFLALTATVAFALTACTDQTDFTQADLQKAAQEVNDGQISFGTYLGKGNTRAEVAQTYAKGVIGNKTDAVLGLTDLKAARFGVFSYFTGAMDYREAVGTWGTANTHWKATGEGTAKNKYPNFMYNQQIYFDDVTGKNAWVYEPVKYWPNGIDAANSDSNPNTSNTPSNTALQKEEGKLSFFAVAPYTPVTTTAYNASTQGTAPTDVQAKTTAKTTSGITAISSNESETDVWVKYLLPNATSTEAEDLLWGLAGKDAYRETDKVNPALTIGTDYNENLTKQIVPERVKFLFKHALAKIGGSTANGDETTVGDPKQCGLKVVADIDTNSSTPKVDGQSEQGAKYFPTDFTRAKTLITLKDVKIQDGKSISDDGTITWVTGKTSDLLTYGWFDIETGKWCEEDNTYGVGTAGSTYNVEASSSDADVNNTTYTINDEIREFSVATKAKDILKSGTKDEWVGTGVADSPLGVNTGTPQPVYANENVPSLLVIPTGNGTVKQTIYVTVDYIVRTADPNLARGYSEVEQIITNEVILDGQLLDPNKYYTLVMHLGLTSVKFEAVVADWAKSDGATFNPETGEVTESGEEKAEEVWLPSNVIENYLTASIANGNFFSNQADHEKVLTVKFQGTEVSDYSKVSVTDLPSWLDYDATNHELKTKMANANAANNEATITVVYAADGDRPELKQKLNVTQYGTAGFVVTATPGTASDGKMSYAANAEHIKLTARLRGVEQAIDGSSSKITVSVATGDPAWLTWDTSTVTDKFLKTAVANTTGSERTKVVTVTYTDEANGVYTATINMTQVSANLVASPTTFNIAKAANNLSDALTVTLNGTDITGDVTVEIPAADTWLKYNSTSKKFEAVTEATAERTSNVTIKYGSLSTTVTVTQTNL